MNLVKQKILFLDRDGTICYDDGAFGSEKYSYKEVIEKTRPLEGVNESLKIAKDKGYLLVVISNQAGIAKGRFDECDTHYSNKLLQEKLNGMIDGFYYCPHHTSGKNNAGIVSPNVRQNLIFDCDCRKPEIGMFIQCENDLKEGKIQYIDEKIIEKKVKYQSDRNSIFKRNVNASIIDKENSYMIGDKWIDVLAGERFGVNAIFVMSGEGEVEYNQKRDAQVALPEKYEIYKDINEFIRKAL